jgi:hypothetical protein
MRMSVFQSFTVLDDKHRTVISSQQCSFAGNDLSPTEVHFGNANQLDFVSSSRCADPMSAITIKRLP